MSNRPWMPLYVADYLADTMHLSAAESGAYLHLIMHYWANDGLPSDDKKLARIARLDPDEWAASRDTIREFFTDGWKHLRIEFELTKAAHKSQTASEAGKASAEARANERSTDVQRTLNERTNETATKRQHLHSQSESKKEEERKAFASDDAPCVDPSIAEKQFFDRTVEILGEAGRSLGGKLLKSQGGNIALARSKLELSATKSNPRQWLAAATGPPRPVQSLKEAKQSAWETARLKVRNAAYGTDDGSEGGGSADGFLPAIGSK